MSLVPAPSLVRPPQPADPAAGARVERCEPADRFHDYVLGEYAPLAPHEGKLRSVSLLHRSFALLGVAGEGARLVDHLRAVLGPFRTVWGIKLGPAGVAGWELYFYDFDRTHADLGIDRLRAALAPVLAIDAAEPHPLPWHMWSVELTPAHLRHDSASPPAQAGSAAPAQAGSAAPAQAGSAAPAQAGSAAPAQAGSAAPAPIDVYIDMRSYKVRGSSYAFENVYTFHDPRADIDTVLHRLRSSVHFDERRDNLGALMPPSLFRCGRLCVANKRSADALYFSRIPTPAARAFLAQHGSPPSLIAFFDTHASELDHLLWDVGLDFRGDDGPLRVTKTSIYGSL